MNPHFRVSARPRVVARAARLALALVLASIASARAGDRVEHVSPTPLLGPGGELIAAGWARRANMIYNREAIPPELLVRIKEWEHYTIMSPEYTVGVTMAQLGGMAFASFELIEYPRDGNPGGPGPGGFFLNTVPKERSVFPDNPYGATRLSQGASFMAFDHADGVRRLAFDFAGSEKAPRIRGELELIDPEQGESVAIARPFAEPGHFFYENKIFGMPASGTFSVGDDERTLPAGTRAIFDWGRGIWPRECSWFWGQGAGTVGARSVAFNLGHGYGDDAKGTCNAILVDGKLHKTEEVILDFDPEDRMKPWTISSSDGRVELRFEPVYRQHAKQAILVAKTELNKIHGRFSGTLTLDDGERIEISGMLGFMEHADHVW